MGPHLFAAKINTTTTDLRSGGAAGEAAEMEKIPAACAMEWSIHLEKALRSKVPGRAVEAVSLAGRRLEQWNLEPEPAMTGYNLFGLVPGEERLFLNAILLRLAGAFVTGERNVKLAVVRAFLGLRKCEEKRRRRKMKDGILSKERVSNSPELLRRVKAVFDSGDVESRAMALVLFGCWAHFAKDSANVRYLILSNLVSSDVSLVKAALFASGCFCELSGDFAPVVLGMLVNLVTSSDVPSTVRWLGVCNFSRMECSYAVADRAYKTGLKLVSESSDEAFIVKMLVSLSKLARVLPLLASEQVGLLCSFLSDVKAPTLQETSLRCLIHMVRRGVCCDIANICINPLLRIIDDSQLSTALQSEAVAILHQILLSSLPDMSRMDSLKFNKLLTCVLTASQSPVESKRLLAIRCLADLSIRLRNGLEMEHNGVSPSLPLDVASLLVDQTNLLVRRLSDVSQIDSKIFVEVRTELSFLLQLVKRHPNLGLLVLDKFKVLIGQLISEHENPVSSPHDGISEDKCTTFSSKFMVILHKFLVACLDILNEIDAITHQVFKKVKMFIQVICNCKFFTLHIQTIYSLLLRSRIIWSSLLRKDEALNENLSHDYWIESEVFSLRSAEKMLMTNDYWLAYECGMLAASQGAWFTATFIFGNLISKAESRSCSCWLKSLAQLSLCEMKIQLLVLPNEELRSVECVDLIKLLPVTMFEDGIGEVGRYLRHHTSSADYGEKLVDARSYLSSSWETLKSCITSGQAFYFQAWFLALRLKMLGIITELVGVLVSSSSNKDAEYQSETQIRTVVESLQKLTQLSVRLKRLSEEFDLIAASFIDIDRRSLKIISALALGCSLLSFAAGFALIVQNRPPCEFLTPSQQKNSLAMLVQNLHGRLRFIDDETSASLSSLSDVGGCPDDCNHPHSRSRALGVGCEVREVLSHCRIAVSRAHHLQDQLKGRSEEELISVVAESGRKLLLDSIMGLMQIPFRTPEYYFRTRPCIGAELFAANADRDHSGGIFVSPGFSLSLSLCIQLKNASSNVLSQPLKLHCVISCDSSFQEPAGPVNESSWCASQSCGVDDMLVLNEHLYQYVTRRATKNERKRARYSSDGKAALAFASFEVNERGQGFSNCLLDVSHFPAGTYKTKWHCCCTDSRGSYWSLIPLNAGPVFTIQ